MATQKELTSKIKEKIDALIRAVAAVRYWHVEANEQSSAEVAQQLAGAEAARDAELQLVRDEHELARKQDEQEHEQHFATSRSELADKVKEQLSALSLQQAATTYWADGYVQKVTREYDRAVGEADRQQQRELSEVNNSYEQANRESEQEYDGQIATARTRFLAAREQLLTERTQSRENMAEMLRELEKLTYQTNGWSDSRWQQWIPAAHPPTLTRFGNLLVEAGISLVAQAPSFTADADSAPSEEVAATGDTLNVPAAVPLIGGRNLLFKVTNKAKDFANRAMEAVMLRMMGTVPPGKLRFTMIDPVGLGQNVASFMSLADHDEALVTSRAWTEPHHIEQRLADLSEHMENVIQKYLRNQYQTIEQYNAMAGEVAESYRVLVVANFPINFSEAAARRLVSIAANGPRCGVYVLVTVDTEQPMPHGFNLADLERVATIIKYEDNRFIWDGDGFRDYPLELDSPPPATVFDRILKQVGEQARAASHVEVPFERIAPPVEQWWQGDSRESITVPLGRAGATKLQMLELGRGTAQHALVGGKTGSGKSTLLHVLITNIALKYRPRELELYLIDFKKGVEFKTYANYQLPHARVIAIESEREFGLSVLQGLDAELKRRGDLFRKAGAQNISEYRKDTSLPCPRILLVVDEFQEFFTEDDSIAQQASLLLDRLVRQGRAFGVHVLLGSQTLAGAYSLARSTIDQMAVRIALQCSEADARLIMSDDNPVARLLSRPGEAVYNAANGMVEGNNRFQIVWLSDEQQDEYLSHLQEFAAKQKYRPPQPQIVFEGNAPADAAKNKPLADLLAAPAWGKKLKAVNAWLGEPVAIKGSTTAQFKPQSGSSLLIVGQSEEAAMGMSLTALLSVAAQQQPGGGEGQPGACFYLLDFSPTDVSYSGLLARLGQLIPHMVRAGGRRQLGEMVAEVAAEVDRRLQAGDGASYPIYLCIYGLHRARDLRPEEDSYSFLGNSEPAPPSPAKQFAAILREGPELGVHTIAWCDTMTNLNRTLERRSLREFEMRIAFQMSAEDSSLLIDSPVASKLGQHRAMFYSEEQGRAEKFRPYGLPTEDWLAEVGSKFKKAAQAAARAKS